MNANDRLWTEARALLTSLDFEQAVQRFRQAATRDPQEGFAERAANEIERLRWARARKDIEGIFVETASLADSAAQVFEMRLGARRVIGRQLLSPLFIEGAIDELFCGRISQDEILGDQVGVRLSERDIRLELTPLSRAARGKFFEKFCESDDAEIVFPYPRLLGRERREPRAHDEGWPLDSEIEARLAAGESTQRGWVVEDIAEHLGQGARVFDPACGTGEVLASVKAKRPDLFTLGQDLSQAMVERAKTRADKVEQQDARFPIAKEGSVDVLILRFLNADVVTTKDAQRLLKRLATTLHPAGRVYAYGHTPMRIDRLDFAAAGLRVLSSVAHDKKGNIFQAYIAERE